MKIVNIVVLLTVIVNLVVADVTTEYELVPKPAVKYVSENEIRFDLPVDGKNVTFKLSNENVQHPEYKVFSASEKGEFKLIQEPSLSAKSCIYRGKAENLDTPASFSFCNNKIRGRFLYHERILTVAPAESKLRSFTSENHLVITALPGKVEARRNIIGPKRAELNIIIVTDPARLEAFGHDDEAVLEENLAIVDTAQGIFDNINFVNYDIRVLSQVLLRGYPSEFNITAVNTNEISSRGYLYGFKDWFADNKIALQRGAGRLIDYASLFTSFDFEGNTIGRAFIDTICSDEAVGVDSMLANLAADGTALAHELGHTIGADHNNQTSVQFVMNEELLLSQPATDWTDENKQVLFDLATSEDCLSDTAVYCGNGVVEAGEECDLGAGVTSNYCNDDCELIGGAECAQGDCCDTSTGLFKSSSHLCRAASSSCDVADYCTGSSAECPADAQVAVFSACNATVGGVTYSGQCYDGECASAELTCGEVFSFVNSDYETPCFPPEKTTGRCNSNGNNVPPECFITPSCDASTGICDESVCSNLRCGELGSKTCFGSAIGFPAPAGVRCGANSVCNGRGSCIQVVSL